jgi:hypothetical protein
MYERVYWHPTNRAITAMAKYCITRLLQAGALDMRDFLEETFFKPYSSALRVLHRRYDAKFGTTDPNPIAHILDGERSIHRVLIEFSVESVKTGRAIAEYLVGCTVFDVAAIEDKLEQEVSKVFPKLRLLPGEMLLDVPAKDRSRPSGERGGAVYVYEGNLYGRGRLLDDVTPMAKVLVKTHETRSKVCRAFISTRVARCLGGEEDVTRLANFVREQLMLWATEATPGRNTR